MSTSIAVSTPQRYRTIWISDVHLGTRGCQADMLLDFLRETESDTLFLVGDIIDGWRLRKKFYWSQSHNDVIQKLLRKARKGTKVFFVPGNHDEFLRDYIGLQFGGVLLCRDFEYTMQDGRRFLICHGDEFDVVTRHHKWVAYLGDTAYTLLLWANTHLNYIRRKIGLPYWSLSAYLKQKAKRAAEFISQFENALADEARRRGLDGVICGHVHHAERRRIQGVDYCNDGDWVESCTALVEHFDGRLEILYWSDEMRARGLEPPQVASDGERDRAPVIPTAAPAPAPAE
ncbi:MAG: UDP-2,3-diacylglucosamine diphosphatase [Pseudomonadota bacterium]